MEPPNAELEQMTTMDKTFKWAQFKVDDMYTKEAVSGSLPTPLGIKKDTATKVPGLIGEADFEATIAKWNTGDARLGGLGCTDEDCQPRGTPAPSLQ